MDITVGALVNVLGDPERVEHFESEFAVVNRALREAGLPEHREPASTKFLTPWSVKAYERNVGMQYLCRLAVYLWDGQPLPPPGNPAEVPDPRREPLLDEYFSIFMGERKRNEHRFNHLLQHYFESGYYVPMEFEKVVGHDDELLAQTVGPIGSSIVLKRELEVLAKELRLPLDLDPNSSELWELANKHGRDKNRSGWERYGLESIACVQLYHACVHSVENRAAIVFNA